MSTFNKMQTFKPEELLVFGYIRKINTMQHLCPDSIVILLCYSFYFQAIGTFLIVFESTELNKDSFIKTCDISNQWKFLPSSTRNTNINHKQHFIQCYESSICIIPSISTNSIPAINPSIIQQMNAITSNVIYRVGGRPLITRKYIDIGCIFNRDITFELPKLNTLRYGNRTVYSKAHGLLTLGGCSMVHEYLSSVEHLMMDGTNKWYWNGDNIDDMNCKRFCASSIVLNNGKYDEKLFVVGGKADHFTDLNTCEMYSFQDRQWIAIASMKHIRNSAGICEWKEKNGDIVVVGGYNGESSKSVEHYDLHKGKWYELSNTNKEHKNCCYVAVYYDCNPYFKSNNGVLVVFGNDGTDKEDWGVIEYYDDRDWCQKWNIVQRVEQCISSPDYTNFLWVLPTQ